MPNLIKEDEENERAGKGNSPDRKPILEVLKQLKEINEDNLVTMFQLTQAIFELRKTPKNKCFHFSSQITNTYCNNRKEGL